MSARALSRLTGVGMLAMTAPALTQDCRLALVLALDMSGSVGAADDRLQREGLAAAFLASDVTRAFLTGGPVALYVFEWADASFQVALLPGWTMIESEQDLLAVAGHIGQSRRAGFRSTDPVADGTAVGPALVHAAAALEVGPDCPERTVDVSGDGVSDHGIEPTVVIETLYDGITVNAFIIEERFEDPMLDRHYGGDTPLVTWFSDTVLHGPGAFAIVANGFKDYERSMTAKLRRELEIPMVSGSPTNPGAG